MTGPHAAAVTNELREGDTGGLAVEAGSPRSLRPPPKSWGASRMARAQTYPTRPVRLIVGFAAGGGTDIAARLMGQWLSERFGHQFIVENRPGAGGNVAADSVVRSPPDGHTLLVGGANDAVNATLYEKLNFNFIRDIVPVAGLTRVPYVLEVNPAFPAKTVPEFIAYAKANSGKLSMGSGGIGKPQLFRWIITLNDRVRSGAKMFGRMPVR